MTTATLSLCRFDNGTYILQGAGDATRNAGFSLFDLDGEGGDPFAFGNRTWTPVEGIATAEYDADDSDTLWRAAEAVLASARAAGIELPEHAL